jgi:hypothetical protein
MTTARAFCKDRDATLRSLDRDRLDRFLCKWNQPRPREWIGDAWLASMHKARLQVDAFNRSREGCLANVACPVRLYRGGRRCRPLSELRRHRLVKFRLPRVRSFQPALRSPR